MMMMMMMMMMIFVVRHSHIQCAELNKFTFCLLTYVDSAVSVDYLGYKTVIAIITTIKLKGRYSKTHAATRSPSSL